MKRCRHTEWLTLRTAGKRVVIHESDRIQRLTSCIAGPAVGRPGLIVFLGDTVKAAALYQLFRVRIKKSKSDGVSRNMNLYLDFSTIGTDRPLFLASESLYVQQYLRSSEKRAERCHFEERYELLGGGSSLDNHIDTIYSRLLHTFADVFCFFALDYGGLKQISRRVAAWMESSNPSTLFSCAYPKLVIVTDMVSSNPNYEAIVKAKFLCFLRRDTKKDLRLYLSSVDVVALVPEREVSPESRYRLLKERLLNSCDQVRDCREKVSALFSITHFAALLHLACKHFCESPTTTFDIVKAARTGNPVCEDLTGHISTFIDRSNSSGLHTAFVVKMIASSLFLDNYPPDSHSKPSHTQITHH